MALRLKNALNRIPIRDAGEPWHSSSLVLGMDDEVCWDAEIGRDGLPGTFQDPAMRSEALGYSLDIFAAV